MTPLATNMHALAAKPTTRPEDAARLRRLADEFEAASTNADPFDAKRMLGAWARARRCWCELTGEPLV